MSYVVCDSRGYVGDLASNRGMAAIREALAADEVLAELADDGAIDVTKEVKAALAALAGNETLATFLKLAKRCQDCIIISDGTSGEEGATKARNLDYAEELRDRLEASMARDISGALKKAFALLRERILSEANSQGIKGGPGSGHFGHAGRPGEVGGSVPGEGGGDYESHYRLEMENATDVVRRSFPKRGLTVYHATEEKAVASIQREGLKRGPTHGRRPASVYFTTNRAQADMWGWGGTHSPLAFGNKYAVVEFTIPHEWKNEVIPDEVFRSPETLRIERDIPPEHIKRVSLHLKETGEGPYYTVIFLAEPEAQKGGEGSGHFGHAGRPGQVGGGQPGDGADVLRGIDYGGLPEDDIPPNPYVGNADLKRYQDARGVNQEADQKVKWAFDGHSNGGDAQANSDARLVNYWDNPDSPEGHALHVRADIEEYSAQRTRPGDVLYRREGKDEGNRRVLSYTTMPGGAVTNPITGGDQVIRPTTRIKLAELRSHGLRILYGYARQHGRPGESEVLVIRDEQGAKQVHDLPDDEELWSQIRLIVQGAMIPHVGKVGRAAARYKAQLGLAVDFDVVNQQLIEYTKTFGNEWWDRLEEPTRDALRETLTTWQETGLDKRGLESLVDALGEVFFDVGPNGETIPDRVRARRIATTETTRLFDQGNRLAELSANIEKQAWLTARDEKVCTKPITFNGVTYNGCGALDGKQFPITEGPFPVEDTHINCRCLRTGVTPLGEVLLD